MTVTAIAPAADTDGARAKGSSKDGSGVAGKPGRSRRKLLLIVLVVALVAGASYWFVLRPKPASTVQVPGIVVPLESIQVNLAGGHYLKVGIALQLVDGVKEADGSKALDALIEEFSGKSIDVLAQPVKREQFKAQLVSQLEQRYHHDVMGVYFTDFVTQ